jgi:hypothetical protein
MCSPRFAARCNRVSADAFERSAAYAHTSPVTFEGDVSTAHNPGQHRDGRIIEDVHSNAPKACAAPASH